MHPLDWLIVVAYLVWMVYDGLKRSKATDEVEGYFLANRSLPWWAVGLSVMATQLSAITIVSTTGQGYVDGMRFIQFYFGLPVAMIILSVTVVPFFYRARVYTAYEYLERRFDARTRALASFLFLLSRAASCGVIISAPAVILSIVFGWNFVFTVFLIGLPTVVYTVVGGVQAVTWTDVKQMVIIVAGMLAAVILLIFGLPDRVSLGEALHLAGATGRMRAIDFTFDVNQTYTFWSGMIGGLFLMLSYFGCDQSQVQRYLTARSIDEGRRSLLMSAFVKIPLQVLILITGVLVFVYYVFEPPPMLFNRVHEAAIRESARAAEYTGLELEFAQATGARREAAETYAAARDAPLAARTDETRQTFIAANARVTDIRVRAATLVRDVTGDRAYGDVNYVFPTFITTRMPIGLIGLLIAAIFAAAMSSIAAELNALATSSIIDFYRRHWRPAASDAHYLTAAKLATALWGAFACVVAVYAAGFGSLIEVVNRLGSLFYGARLGAFILAIGVRRATARGAFYGLLAGELTVIATAIFLPRISFLWHNVVGVVATVAVGMAISLTQPQTVRASGPAQP